MNETHLDVFSGLGGFAIAAREAGFQTVAFCESDPRCRAFLEKSWGLTVEPDIRKLDGRKYTGVSLLTGGPPCQPASRAGKQEGAGDDRWLWGEALRVLAEAKPDCVIFENPPGILDVGIDGILSEMGRLGYETQPFDIPACAMDSPQLRHRIWIVGFLADTQRKGRKPTSQLDGQSFQSREPTSRRNNLNGCDGRLADARCQRGGKNEPGRGESGRAVDRRDCKNELADAEKQGPKRQWRRRVDDGKAGWQEPNGSTPSCNQSELASMHIESGTAGGQIRQLRESSWSNAVWVPCADGKLRRAPDDSQRMANGLPMELLEGLAEEVEAQLEKGGSHFSPHRSILGALGNSIVPQVAVEILKAVRKNL